MISFAVSIYDMDTQQALALARQYKAAVLAHTKLPIKAVNMFGSYA